MTDALNRLMKPVFIEFDNGAILDITQVEYVSPVVGDSSDRRYTLRLRSGFEVEIRDGHPNKHRNLAMSRTTLIKAITANCGVGFAYIPGGEPNFSLH